MRGLGFLEFLGFWLLGFLGLLSLERDGFLSERDGF